MGFKKGVVIFAVTAALVSYWLYSPLPHGFSSESKRQFQAMAIGFKFMELASNVGSRLGFASKAVLQRYLANKLIKDFGPKSNIEGIVTTDAVFDGIPVRIYKPVDSQNEILPGIIFYHGGGFILGSIEWVEAITLTLCRDTRSVVVSVEYRLAPEFPFPAAIDDCVKATKYFLSNAADFNVDAKRIATSGDSAGGNLATTVPMKLRDEKFSIPIKLQVLIYPWIQSLDFNLPSMIQNRDGPLLTRDMLAFFATIYAEGHEKNIADYISNRHVTKSFREKIAKSFLNVEKLPKEFLEGYERPLYPEGDEKIWNEIKDKMTNPYHSPLTAENLQNLPEAFVFTANFDPLRDEGYLYGLRLKEANNKVTLYNAEIGFHGIGNYLGMLVEADAMFAEITKFIREKL